MVPNVLTRASVGDFSRRQVLHMLFPMKNSFQPVAPYIQKLKLRASYGLVGNDNIAKDEDRFLYLSEINMNNSGSGASLVIMKELIAETEFR